MPCVTERAALAVQALLEDADADGLEVEHQVAADHAAGVAQRRTAEVGEQAEARALDGAGGEDEVVGGRRLAVAVASTYSTPVTCRPPSCSSRVTMQLKRSWQLPVSSASRSVVTAGEPFELFGQP